MAEFMFVNLNNPTQNKRREVRKLVRSHVSHVQHSLKRTELGQVQKPSKSRYVDRSVNGWAVFDDGKAGQQSQMKISAAFGLAPRPLVQHESTLPDSDLTRSPRQLYYQELPATDKSRRRTKQGQRQPKASPTSPTPILGTEVNVKESPQVVGSTLSTVKCETAATSPEGVFVKQELDHEKDGILDIVSEHSSRSQSLSSSSAFQRGWEGDKPAGDSFTTLYSSLGDPTDELRNRIELAGIGLSSALVLMLSLFSLAVQQRKLTLLGFPNQSFRLHGPRL
jgi:hypothetical protein